MKKFATAIVIAAGLIGSAHAAKFNFIGDANDGTSFYVDSSSLLLEQNGRTRSAWVKSFEPNRSYHYDRFEVNCSNRMWRVTTSNSYSSNGTLVDSGMHTSGWEYSVPDSFGEATVNFICKIR